MTAGEFNHEKQAISEKRTYSAQEITDILQISRNMIYDLYKQSLFKIVKIDKYVRVSKPSFDGRLDTRK